MRRPTLLGALVGPLVGPLLGPLLGLLLGPLIGLNTSCVTTPEPPAGARMEVRHGDVVDFEGPAAFSARATTGNREDVVHLVGFGELVINDAGCRLMRYRVEKSTDAASPDRGVLEVWTAAEPGRCLTDVNDRLCLAGPTAFLDGKGERFDVSGCAERNTIFLDRVDQKRGRSIGPTSYFEHCVDVDDSTNATYLKLNSLTVDDNDNPMQGTHFRYDEGFALCFLTTGVGRYDASVTVEVPGVPTTRDLHLEGEIDQ